MHPCMQNNKVDASEEAGREEGNACHHREKRVSLFCVFPFAAESLIAPSLPYPRTFIEREIPLSIKPPPNKRKLFSVFLLSSLRSSERRQSAVVANACMHDIRTLTGSHTVRF